MDFNQTSVYKVKTIKPNHKTIWKLEKYGMVKKKKNPCFNVTFIIKKNYAK